MDTALTGVRGRRNAVTLNGEFSADELRAIADNLDGQPPVEVTRSEIDDVKRQLIRMHDAGDYTHCVCSTCGHEWKAKK